MQPSREEDGAAVIERNLAPAFDALTGPGYTIHYRVERLAEGMASLYVWVKHGQAVIAAADFSDTSFGAHCQNIRVEPAYQRRGIANAVCVFAEKVLGKHLEKFWDEDQLSAAGRALWAQPNRPFGRQSRREGEASAEEESP